MMHKKNTLLTVGLLILSALAVPVVAQETSNADPSTQASTDPTTNSTSTNSTDEPEEPTTTDEGSDEPSENESDDDADKKRPVPPQRPNRPERPDEERPDRPERPERPDRPDTCHRLASGEFSDDCPCDLSEAAKQARRAYHHLQQSIDTIEHRVVKLEILEYRVHLAMDGPATDVANHDDSKAKLERIQGAQDRLIEDLFDLYEKMQALKERWHNYVQDHCDSDTPTPFPVDEYPTVAVAEADHVLANDG